MNGTVFKPKNDVSCLETSSFPAQINSEFDEKKDESRRADFKKNDISSPSVGITWIWAIYTSSYMAHSWLATWRSVSKKMKTYWRLVFKHQSKAIRYGHGCSTGVVSYWRVSEPENCLQLTIYKVKIKFICIFRPEPPQSTKMLVCSCFYYSESDDCMAGRTLTRNVDEFWHQSHSQSDGRGSSSRKTQIIGFFYFLWRPTPPLRAQGRRRSGAFQGFLDMNKSFGWLKQSSWRRLSVFSGRGLWVTRRCLRGWGWRARRFEGCGGCRVGDGRSWVVSESRTPPLERTRTHKH